MNSFTNSFKRYKPGDFTIVHTGCLHRSRNTRRSKAYRCKNCSIHGITHPNRLIVDKARKLNPGILNKHGISVILRGPSSTLLRIWSKNLRIHDCFGRLVRGIHVDTYANTDRRNWKKIGNYDWLCNRGSRYLNSGMK